MRRISGMNRRSSAQKVTADRQNKTIGRRKLADLVQDAEKTLYVRVASQFGLAQLMVAFTGV